jgi:hypothetical protein
MQISFRSVSSRIPSWLATLVVCTAAMAFLPSCKKEAGGDGSANATPAPDLSTPKKAAIVFSKAVDMGDMDTARQTCTGTDEQFASIKGMNDMLAALKRYNVAAVAKFGDKGKLPADAMPDLSAETAKKDEKIDGDKATMVAKDKPDEKYPMTLKRESGNWKVDLSSMPPELVEMGKSAKKTANAIDAVSKDVEAGKYKTPQEAMTAVGGAMNGAH